MHTSESFKVGLSGLLANKMRALLTMLGIVFGVAAVIAMVSIGEGAREETLKQIELLGTNNIIVNRVKLPPTLGATAPSYSLGLTLKDADAVETILPTVQSVTPVRQQKAVVSYQSSLTENTIIGTTPNYPETFNSKMIAGSFFKDFHLAGTAPVCILGAGVKAKLFPYEDAIGKKIKIGEMWFSILGVVSPKDISSSGMSTLGMRNFNNDIYIPISTMMSRLEKREIDENMMMGGNFIVIGGSDDYVKSVDKNSIDQLTVKIKSGESMPESALVLQRILQRRHYSVADFEIVLPEQLLEQKQRTQRIFNIVMGAIAGISLLVGGIGIMNIMLANIMERTREIGVRRAVGATRTDILMQFMFEAVTISIIGGLLGVITGFLLTQAISSYAGWTTVLSPAAVFVAFIVSAATGIVFGIYPAKKAADKNPIESLRYE